MANLTSIRDAAVSLLAGLSPERIRVEPFSGEITFESVTNKTLPPGVSVLVAAVGAENDAAPDSLDFDAVGTFGVLVVSNNLQSPEARETEALATAEAAALALHGATFGLSGVTPANVRTLEAVKDAELDRAGVSIWAVVWQQAFTFGA